MVLRQILSSMCATFLFLLGGVVQCNLEEIFIMAVGGRGKLET